MDIGTPGRLSTANSPARKRKKSASLLDPYHNIASTFFSLGKGNTTDITFLEAARDGDYEKIEALLQRRNESLINIDVRDKETGNTPVIWAAKRGHIKIIQLLLKNGADITLRNYEGQTALEMASPQVQQLLLDSVDKGGPHRNLLQAAWQGNARLVRKILTETRVDINCKNADSLTPLLLVTRDIQLFEKLGEKIVRRYDPVEVMQLLLQNRADPNMEDEEGKSALHFASSSKAQLASYLVEMLLNDGSDTDARDRRSFTPIHCASQSGNVNVVQALLDGGSDANARGYAGTTPLHVSAINGHDDVACTLLESGANVTLVDDSGLTPVDVAKTRKVKSTLKQAWTEATQVKTEKTLNPLRQSVQFKPSKSPRRTGQVIFDIPELPTSACTPRIVVNQNGERETPVTVSLIDLSLATSGMSGVDPLTPRRSAVASLERHIASTDRTRRSEEQTNRDLYESRGYGPSSSHTKGNHAASVKRLNPIRSPRKNSTGGLQKETRFYPGTKMHDGRCHRTGSSGQHQTLKKCYSDPSKYPGSGSHQIPVTILGLDLDENLQEVRVQRIVQGPPGHCLPKKGHSRHNSDQCGYEYDDIFLKGRSPTKLSMTSVSEDIDERDEDCFSAGPSRCTMRTPSASDRNGRLRIPQTIKEAHSAGRNPSALDLDRMQLTNQSQTPLPPECHNYPNSRKMLPPTPLLPQYTERGGDSDYSSDYRMTDVSQEPFLSSKESSPRSDEEEIQHEPAYFDYHQQVKKAISNVKELTRSKSTLKQGTFHIETSRVKGGSDQDKSNEVTNSNDSGCSVETAGETTSKLQKPQKKDSGVEGNGERFKTTSSPPRTNQVKCKNDSNSGKETQPKSGKNNNEVRADTNTAENRKTHVTLVKAPNVKKTEVKSNQPNVPKDSTNKTAVKSTYETTRIAPSQSARKPAANAKLQSNNVGDSSSGTGNQHSVSKVNARVISSHDLKQPEKEGSENNGQISNKINGDKNKPVMLKETSNLKNKSSGKSTQGTQKVPPPRPTAPPRQNSNLVKTKITPKPLQKDNSKVGFKPKSGGEGSTIKPNSIKHEVKAKPVVPPRPKSVLSGSQEAEKSQVTPETGRKESTGSISRPEPKQQRPKQPPPPPPPSKAKPDTANAVNSEKPTVIKISANTKAAPSSAPGTSANDDKKVVPPVPPAQSSVPGTSTSDDKKEVPPVPIKPQSVKPKLIKVASAERISNASQPPNNDTPICKITINGKESTVPDYNPKLREIQKPTVCKSSNFSPTNSPKTARKVVVTDKNANITSVKAVKIDTRDDRPESKVKFDPRPEVSDHEGPVIWDPFEQIRERNKQSTEHLDVKDDGNKVRTKSAKGNRLTVPQSRKSSGKTRTNSASKRNKVKPTTEAGSRTNRPKSPKKKQRKTKKNPNGGKELTTKEDPDNVAFVSGIGWHLDIDKTPTFTKVKAFKFKPPGDFSSDDEEYPYSSRIQPDYSTGANMESKTPRSYRAPTVLPNAAVSMEELEEYTSADESDDDDIDAEDVVDDIVEFRHPRDSTKKSVDSSTSEEGELSKALTNVSSLATDYKNVNMPHVALATKVTLERTSLSSSQEADQVLPDVETTASGAAVPPETKAAKAKVIAVKSAKVENKFKSKRNSSPKRTQIKITGNDVSPGSIRNGKKPVSNPISPGASVPDKKIPGLKAAGPSDNETKNSAPSKADNKKAETKIKGQGQTKKEPLGNTKANKDQEKIKSARTEAKTVEESQEKKSNTEDEVNNQQVDNCADDLNNMIDEIFKNTPNPSLTLSCKSNESDIKEKNKEKQQNKKSRETFEKQMRSSHDGKTFRQIQNSASSHDDAGSDGTSWPSSSTTSSGAAEDLNNLHNEFDIDSDEKRELEKLMNSLKNMELMVSLPLEGGDSHFGIKTPVSKRPPLPPNANNKNASLEKSSESESPVIAYIPERSPRFVRKRDSLKDSARKNSNCMDNSPDFGSDDSNTIVTDGSHIVTNRMGSRSVAGSRASSSLNDTLNDDSIETIQWKRGNQLGKGAYGIVWCGLTNAGQLIAVKQIELNIADMDLAEEEYEKIHEEVDLLKTLNHKNIVGYLGTSLEDNIVSIFMEFVPGGSVGSLLARFGALEEQVFCLYTKQILEGVEYLHANNVIHRDIKGGNIMLMPNGVIKLIDFGCAKRLCLNVNAANSSHGSSRLLKSMRGTPYWMAPEVAKEIGYGTKSDIWSIGCTVFEMATRKPPWSDVPPMAAIFAIGSDKPVPQLPEKFSQNARDFVNACLTRCQTTRPNATQLLQHPFIVKYSRRK